VADESNGVGFGFVGGGVKKGKTLRESLISEFLEEFGKQHEHDGGDMKDFNLVFNEGTIHIVEDGGDEGSFKKIKDLAVVQKKDGKFRAGFHLFGAHIDLSKEQFTLLNSEGLLVSADEVGLHQMRPYVRAIVEKERKIVR
jgi:8-oxo-dGTP pyrophosphatase MutT (NUDIX family)